MDDHTERPARTDRDRRLDVQILFDDALAGLVCALWRRLPDRLDQVAVLAPEGDLTSYAENGGEDDPFEKLPSVIVDLILEPGISCCIGRRQIVDLDRRTVRHDDALPDKERTALTEGDNAVVGADQARSMRDEQCPPGDRVVYVLGDLADHLAGQIRVDPGKQASRDD